MDARRAQWLATLLLSSLLLRGAPLDSAEALRPEQVLEWQGECPPVRRDQTGTSGTRSPQGRAEGGRLGRARAAGFAWWQHRALRMGAPCRRTGPAPLPRALRLLAWPRIPQVSAADARGGGRACRQLGSALGAHEPGVAGQEAFQNVRSQQWFMGRPRSPTFRSVLAGAGAPGVSRRLWRGPRRASPLRPFPDENLIFSVSASQTPPGRGAPWGPGELGELEHVASFGSFVSH